MRGSSQHELSLPGETFMHKENKEKLRNMHVERVGDEI
jgi:hypothetical protein